MLSSSNTFSCPTVIEAADAFVTQVQSIATSVQDWAQATISKDFFLNSVGTLARKVEDIGQRAQKARKSQETGSVESDQIRRLCEEVRAGLAAAYLIVEQNAQIQNPADERFFFDHLEQLEKGWCSHDAPLYAHYTQAHDPVAPSEIEALDSTDFLLTLGKYSDSFGGHPVSCFVSYAEADGPSFAAMLCKHLKAAGVNAKIPDDLDPRIARQQEAVERAVQDADYVIVLGSRAYVESIRSEQPLILQKGNTGRLLRALVGGTVLRSFPTGISHSRTGYADFRKATDYHSQTIDLLKCLYTQAKQAFPVLASPAIPKIHPIQARLRQAYAEKPAFRRFMGEEVKFESAYVVPNIFASMKGSKRFWITGEPGTGKSTLCHYIAYLYGTSQEHQLGGWAQDCSGIIWIPLKELLLYDKNDISLAQLVADLWFKGTIVSGLEQWLQSPNLIYLLDSEEESHHLLNEKSARGRLLKQLLDKPRSIITSRTDERSPETTRKIELPLLDNAAVEVFVDRYFTDADTPDQASLFLESIPHTMRELMQVPLTLELLCHRWSKVEDHATAPILLYQGILADLCRLKAKKLGENLSTLTDKEVEAGFSALPYLFEIAFQAKMQRSGDLIDSAVYVPILEQVEVGQRNLVYEQLFADETFVRRVGQPACLSNQSYVFHHAVFMEYCAARHIVKKLAKGKDSIVKFIETSTSQVNIHGRLQVLTLVIALFSEMDLEWCLLYRAVVEGCVKKIEEEVNSQTLVDQRFTLLCLAAANGRTEVVKLLLKTGAKAAENEGGRVLLHLALANRHVEVVELLLGKELEISGRAQGEMPRLHCAAVLGELAVIKLLLGTGDTIDQRAEDGATPLHWGVVGGHVEVVEFLLKEGAEVGSKMENGATPLHIAVAGGHIEVVQLLLEKGAAIDQVMEDEESPLHLAANCGRIEVVQLLLEGGALIDQIAKAGRTPLYVAAKYGHVEVVKLLLEKGALIDQTEEKGATPLYIAAFGGHVEVVQLFLEKGAAIDQTTKAGRTPLYVAAKYGHVEVVQLLLKGGALIDQIAKAGRTPLYVAANCGRIEVVQLLLEGGALIDQIAKAGQTPLYVAADCGHVEVVQLLLKEKATIDKAMEGGWTPLHRAAARGHVKVVKLLLEKGAAIDQTTKGGRTPLHIAIERRHVEVERLLLEMRALIEPIGENKEPPLHRAASGGHIEMAKLLLGRGAEVNQKMKDGLSPLHMAALFGHLGMAELLLEKGATIDLASDRGATPLHIAAAAGYVEIVDFFLKRGAAINGVEKNRKTPLHCAAKCGRIEVARLLVEREARLDLVTAGGLTALGVAERYKRQGVVEFLTIRTSTLITT